MQPTACIKFDATLIILFVNDSETISIPFTPNFSKQSEYTNQAFLMDHEEYASIKPPDTYNLNCSDLNEHHLQRLRLDSRL